MTDLDRHDLKLCDVTPEGRIRVAYVAIHRGNTITAVRDVSALLPFECVTLFEDGHREVCDLTDEERAWIRAEAEPNDIDFEGVVL